MVFQLAALATRGTETRGERFSVNLDAVDINAEEVRGVLLCVQDSVRSAHFTQRSFFSESGLTMVYESVAIAGSNTSSCISFPWSLVGTTCAGQIVSDLCACWFRVVLLRRIAKHNSERWYHYGFSGSQTESRSGVPTSDVVEEGLVEYVSVTLPALGPPGPSKNCFSPASGREKSLEPPWSRRRNLKFLVLLLLPRTNPWYRIWVLHPLWQHRHFVGILVEMGGIDVPPKYSRWVFQRDSLL